MFKDTHVFFKKEEDKVMFKDTHVFFKKEEDKGVDILMQDDGATSVSFASFFGNSGFSFVRANGPTRSSAAGDVVFA